MTWLEFNRRVLHEAEDERTPLLERLKFIAIVSANLDEFFMMRLGGLIQQVGACVRELTLNGLTPLQQIQEIHSIIRSLESSKFSILQNILGLLEDQGVVITPVKKLAARDNINLRKHFAASI